MKNKGFKGKKHSLASLQKMRLAKLGKKRPPFSAQWIKNLVNSRKGYRHSCETKKKIGLSNKEYFDNHPERSKNLSNKQKEAWIKNPNRELDMNGLKKGWRLAKLRREKKNKKICPICKKRFNRRGNRKITILCCSKKCASIANSGENNHWWKDGKSREPYPIAWRQTLKKSIRERDKYTCNICKKFGKHVHHIDYNKNNLNPKNLITLCSSCHSKTNNNRKDWRKFFNGKRKKAIL